jgi:hypothetical protein
MGGAAMVRAEFLEADATLREALAQIQQTV